MPPGAPDPTVELDELHRHRRRRQRHRHPVAHPGRHPAAPGNGLPARRARPSGRTTGTTWWPSSTSCASPATASRCWPRRAGETDTATVLFDVGPYGDVWLANAERLGVDLSSIDVLFVSHWHWDHTRRDTRRRRRHRRGARPCRPAAAPRRRTPGPTRPARDAHALGTFAMLPAGAHLRGDRGGGRADRHRTRTSTPWPAASSSSSGDIPRTTATRPASQGTTPGVADGAPQTRRSTTSASSRPACAAGEPPSSPRAPTPASSTSASRPCRLLPEQPIDLLLGGYHLAGAAVEDRIGPTVAGPRRPRRTADRLARSLHRLARRERPRRGVRPLRLRPLRRRDPLRPPRTPCAGRGPARGDAPPDGVREASVAVRGTEPSARRPRWAGTWRSATCWPRAAVNPVPWARSQMAFTLAFHIILVPLGVSWAFMTLIANYRGAQARRRRRPAARPAVVEVHGGHVRRRRGDRHGAELRVRAALAAVHGPVGRGVRRAVRRSRGSSSSPRRSSSRSTSSAGGGCARGRTSGPASRSCSPASSARCRWSPPTPG